ncbi:MAG: tetratricopeptide repeat protein [Gemmatimonadaceae bacterium]
MNARKSLVFAALALVGVAPAHAQESKSRITVMTFKSSEKGMGAKAAEELRDQLKDKFNAKDLYVLPTKDVSNTLVQSGFSATEPLAPNDEKALANLLRADEFVTGTVDKSAAGDYTVNARLVLARDITLSQALPPATNKKVGDAMDAVSKSISNALKQMEGEQQCVAKARTGDIAGALAAAQKGIAAYPQATLARLCAANVRYAAFQKATSHADSVTLADSVLAITRMIAQLDPKSVAALTFNSQLYKVIGDSAQSRATLLSLIRADPNNDKLITQVVNELAGSGHASEAIPLVKELLDRSPGDPQLLRTAFLVYLAASDWQAAVTAGPELIRADTAAADSTYFPRMAAAYMSLNQASDSAQAITILQTGVQKFPNNADMLLSLASSLRKANRVPESLEVLKRAIAINPNNPQALLVLADSYAQANRPDSVEALLQRASTLPGADKHTLAQYALGQGSNMYKAANASKDRAAYQAAIKMLQLSDSIEPSVDAKFIAGASAVSVAQSAYNDANPAKSCELATTAHDALALAQAGVQAGMTSDLYKASAAQYEPLLAKFLPASAAQVKAYCK